MTACKICNGAEQNIFYDGDEPSDPIDCVCTDMRWDSENHDDHLEPSQIFPSRYAVHLGGLSV